MHRYKNVMRKVLHTQKFRYGLLLKTSNLNDFLFKLSLSYHVSQTAAFHHNLRILKSEHPVLLALTL